MKEKVNFLFIIDISGSMYEQKIESVNASLAECIAELKQIGHSSEYDIRVSIMTFAEKMKFCKINEKIDNIGMFHAKVEPQEDGLYLITLFSCLYKGLKYLFDSKTIFDGQQGKNTFIFLFSDARAVDEKAYNAAYEAIQNCIEFKNAIKYFGYVEVDCGKFNRETVRFVDCKADRIVSVSEVPREISKLQMTFFANFTSMRDNTKYDQIFK